MKILDPTFQTALSAETTTIAWCWRIDRTDNISLGFTNFDQILVINGLNYEPQTGFDPSANDIQEGLQRNNSQNLAGILDSTKITAEDLQAGKYDYAYINCFLVDVTNLPSTLELNPPKHLTVYQGKIGKITKTDRSFSLEARGIDYELEATLGKLTSKFCRNIFGDAICGVSLAPHTFSQIITGVTNSYQVTIDGSFTNGDFDRGLLTIGNVSRDIATFVNNIVTLFQPFPTNLEIGMSITLVKGCPKTLLACAKFGGTLNNQSEPHVPLPDDALNTPVSSS